VLYDAPLAEKALRLRDAALDDARVKALQPAPDPPATVTTTAATPALTGKRMMKYFQKYSDIIFPVLKKRFETLEARVTTLEAKPHVKFCGVWKAGTTYEPGDAATHQGGLWICKVATPGEPSKDFHGWTLAVKRGQAT
jgi:hypothetical protein